MQRVIDMKNNPWTKKEDGLMENECGACCMFCENLNVCRKDCIGVNEKRHAVRCGDCAHDDFILKILRSEEYE